MSELFRLEAGDIGGIGFVICFFVEVDIVVVVVVVDSFVVDSYVVTGAVGIVVVEAEFTVAVEAEVLDMVVEVVEVVVVVVAVVVV